MKSEVIAAFEQAPWPAMLVDSAGAVHCANPAAAKIFGAPLEVENPKLAVIWSIENSRTIEEFLGEVEAAGAVSAPLRFHVRGGQTLGFVVAACVRILDARKEFLLQLHADLIARPAAGAVEPGTVQKNKLEVALQLSRTVALDFNNALTSILGHTSLILSQAEPGHPWHHSLVEVEKSAARAAEVANDLATFSRQDKENRAAASGNLNQVLQRAVDLLRKNPGTEPPEWTTMFERTLFAARFDEARLQQAFVKILENAVQAVPPRGWIQVSTRNLELAAPAQDQNVQLATGAYVIVDVADNGAGIAPENLPRIFEPFFTTKQGKEHRGLGLALAYGIISNLGGGIAVSSQLGAGTSVRIYVPAEARVLQESTDAFLDLSGHETVLMVDDEDLMLTMGQTVLGAYGYKVLKANSGQRALDILSETAEPIHLLLTDLVMPGISGRELVEHVQAFSPYTRILRMSGYAWPAGSETDPAYLQKPFTSQDLLRKVRRILSEGEPQA